MDKKETFDCRVHMNRTDGRLFNVCSIIFMVIATIYSFSMVFFGLDFKDTFYWCCEYQYSNAPLVLVPFTQGAFLFIRAIFGDGIIAFRITNWLIYFAGYLLLWYFLKICGLGSRNIRILLVSFAVALIPIININVFNGNQFSVLFLICTFISFYFYENRDRNWIYGVMLFASLAILARFPNIVVIPMILFVSFFVCKDWKDYLRIGAAMVVSVLVYVTVCSFLFHSFSDFGNALATAFGLNKNDSEPAAHSVADLFNGYLISLSNVVRIIKYLSLIVLILFLSFCSQKKWMSFVLPMVFIVTLIVFVKLRINLLSGGWWALNLFFYASIFIVAFIICGLALLRRNLRDFGWGIAPILFSVCAAAGSDTGLFLMGGPLYAFMPFLLLKMIRMLKAADQNEIFALAVSMAVLSVGSFCYVREGLTLIGVIILAFLFLALWFIPVTEIACFSKIRIAQNNNSPIAWYVMGILVMNLALSIYARCNVVFSDKPLRELTCQHEDPKLKHIWTNSRSVGFVKEVISMFEKVKSEHDVIFYGRASFVFSYHAKQPKIPHSDFSQEGKLNIQALQKAIATRPIVFLIPDNPAATDCYHLDNYQKEDEMLKDNGYECESHGTFAVYKPISENLDNANTF